MSAMYENKEVEERVLLVAVRQQDGDDTEESVAELAELAFLLGRHGCILFFRFLDSADRRKVGRLRSYIHTGF